MAWSEEGDSVDDTEGRDPYDPARITGAEQAPDTVSPGRSVFASPEQPAERLRFEESAPRRSVLEDDPVVVGDDDPLADWPARDRAEGTDGDSGGARSESDTVDVTGVVPTVRIGESSRSSSVDDDLAAWSGLPDATPRWADSEPIAAPPEVPTAETGGPAMASTSDDFFDFDEGRDEPLEEFHHRVGADTGVRTGEPGGPSGRPDRGRDMNRAVVTGVGLGVLAIVAFMLGETTALVLVTALLGVSVAEFYVATRRAGYQPAALVGIAATVGLSLATYWRFEAAIPVVLVVTLTFTMLYFLTSPTAEAPVLNLGVTLLGVLYVGLLGSFAALMLTDPNGTGLLLAAILVTVGYDVGGLVVGQAAGRSPLSNVSPNKTLEGLVGGMVASVLVAVVVVGLIGITPFGDGPGGLGAAFVLGLVAAVAAPLGDLCESLLKRDLGIKDMGTILPGHGGLLDRFDALLFVLPAAYFVARVLDLLS